MPCLGDRDAFRARNTLLDDEGLDDDEAGPFLCGEKLRTLLEVSVGQMAEDPFATALASLDALHLRTPASYGEGYPHPHGHLVSDDLGEEHDIAPHAEGVFDPSANLAFGSLDLTFSADQMHALFRPRFTTVSLGEGLAKVHPGLRRSMGGFIAHAGCNEVLGPCCFVDGSFKDCPEAPQAEVGWSCIFCEGSLATCTLLSGPLPSWSQEDLVLASAFRADCCATVVGLWLGVARWQYQGFTAFSDCRAAIDIASGAAGTRVNGIASVLGNVSDCCRAFSGNTVRFAHVAGHTGNIGNEFADMAAKSAARGFPLGSLTWQLEGHPGPGQRCHVGKTACRP